MRLPLWQCAESRLMPDFAFAGCVIELASADKSDRCFSAASRPLLPQVGDRVAKRGDRKRYPARDAFIIASECPDEVERHQGGATRVERHLDVIDRPELVVIGRRRSSCIFHRISHLRVPVPEIKF